MQLSTTFRHMDGSQAVREYTAEKLDKIHKYFKGPTTAHAVFSVERGFHHCVDLSVTLPSGLVVNAKETTEDMYSSIDLATARIERQVRRWKDKIRDHKPHGGPAATVREFVIPADEIEPQPSASPEAQAPAEPPAPSPGYRIIKDERVTARSMTVEDAVMQLNLLGDEILVFTDADTGATTVLYRRRDGNYGMIATTTGGVAAGGKPAR